MEQGKYLGDDEMAEEYWKDLMLDGSVTLFWNNNIYEKNIEAVKAEGFDIYSFDCIKWEKDNFHKELANILGFPAYYGENLNAFNDCLSDMIPNNKGFVLVFRNYDIFAKKYPDIAFRILDIIQINSWRFLIEGTILLGFVQSNDGKLTFPPLGGMTADWNREEWFNKNRGL
ncbi:barstar family protein [Alkalihalobacillus sp. AL-G]|uniref:barstar family protein n=1 Tax=Alkalihalobacillus sp. AL-G TaxID=2926399 RepID=UPI00272CA9BC|nr:barstar family protein [Alkalihalobacillus sp. AL-G]WLD92484.1 barstar family protein [Alkalihalobacillus sp. AL-G]